MTSRIATKETLFKQVRAGRLPLRDLLEAERHELYDYVLRMTADVSRASDAVDEVLNSVEAGEDQFNTLEALRTCVYRTARSFNADAWNTDTRLLVNTALEGDGVSSSALPLPGKEKALRDEFIALDRLVRQLPADEREALLLRMRGNFSEIGVADVMGLEAELVRVQVKAALDKLVAQTSKGPTKIAKLEACLQELPLHPMPTLSTYQTTNLSELIGDLRETRGISDWPWVKILLLAAVAGGVCYSLYVFFAPH